MTRSQFKRLVHADADGCWIWQRSVRGNGYAQCSQCDEPSRMASRLAYRLYKGDPGSLWVLHRCDKPNRVRPAHLFLGTAAENTYDMLKKGRFGRHVVGRLYNTVNARKALASKYENKEFRSQQGSKISAGLRNGLGMRLRSLRRSGWGHPWRLKDLDVTTRDMVGQP